MGLFVDQKLRFSEDVFCKSCGSKMDVSLVENGFDPKTGEKKFIKTAICSSNPCHTEHDYEPLPFWRRGYYKCKRCGYVPPAAWSD